VYRHLTELAPSVAIYNQVGQVLTELHRGEEAIAIFQQAKALDAKLTEIYIGLGDSYSQIYQWQDGITAYQQALELDPENPLTVEDKLQRAEQKQSQFEQAVKTHSNFPPTSAEDYLNLGQTLRQQGLIEDALAAFRQACILNPHSPINYHLFGHSFAMVQKWDDAISCYRRACEIFSESPDIHLHWGEALEQKENYQDALTYLQKAINLKPDFDLAYEAMGRVISKKKGS